MDSLTKSKLQEPSHQDKAFKYASQIFLDAVESRPTRPLVLIIGNGGVINLPFQRRDKFLDAYRRRERAIGADPKNPNRDRLLVWRYNETLRQYSENRVPRPALIYLVFLVIEKLCSLIVTPNYDRFLQSVFKRIGVSYVVNPIETPNPSFNDGYGIRSDSSCQVTVWKYHGDVGYALFDRCGDVFKLPNFPVLPFSPFQDDLDHVFQSPVATSPDHLHHFQSRSHATGWPDHYIDFNFPNKNRSEIFLHEISGAIKAIQQLDSKISGIIVVGFAGRWASGKTLMSEEIVPVLLEKIKNGVPTTMIFNPSERDLSYSELARRIWQINPAGLWITDIPEALLRIFSSIPPLRAALSLQRVWGAEGIFD